MFSTKLTGFSLPKNDLYQIRDRLLGQGEKILDLTSANPTKSGINFPKPILKKAFLDYLRSTHSYQPDPKGLKEARSSIGKFYKGGGRLINPDNILLTPGTSESYFYIFKLLCTPGQEILCPRPSYPLFDYIAQLCDVRLKFYDLLEDKDWQFDLPELESLISPRTAAIVLISPHNPTGHVVTKPEIEGLLDISRRYHKPLVIDEVFNEFIFSERGQVNSAVTSAPLVFILNGISKMLALPQMKLGWIAVAGGDSALVGIAVDRLETIADTFLATAEFPQYCLPTILSEGQEFLETYKVRVHDLLETTVALLKKSEHWDFILPDGGFYFLVKPKVMRDFGADHFALNLLSKYSILLHPGSFYDFPSNYFLVFSFLSGEFEIKEGLRRMIVASDHGL